MAREFARWLYSGGHPNALAKALNNGWAWLCSLGIAPDYLVTMEVRGRRTGRILKLPLVMVVVDHERYLVSMLGERSDWVLTRERGRADRESVPPSRARTAPSHPHRQRRAAVGVRRHRRLHPRLPHTRRHACAVVRSRRDA